MSRNISFDIMKGIGIMCVIAGHCIIPNLLHRFIYMWHMPLFFFVSGYFFRPKDWKNLVLGSFRGLIIPYVITCALILFITLFTQTLSNSNDFLTRLQGMLTIDYYFNSTEMKYGGAGALWFLPALFWCRIIYNALNRLTNHSLPKLGGVLIFSYSAVCIGQEIYVPLFLCQGFQCLVFYHFGYECNRMNIVENNNLTPFKFTVLLCGISIGMSLNTIFCFALYYSCWLLNVLAAICAILLISVISYYITQWKYSIIIAWLGRYSLLILCIHASDSILGLTSSIAETHNTTGKILYNITYFSIALSLTYILSRSEFIRILFKIK